jgi:hypothetical protein
VKCLLDVSALVALGIAEHEFHERVANWVRDLGAADPLELATCSITEIGFVRIVAQTPQYAFSVTEARILLLRLKTRHRGVFTFIADYHDATRLPGWVKGPRQVTDGPSRPTCEGKWSGAGDTGSRYTRSFLDSGVNERQEETRTALGTADFQVHEGYVPSLRDSGLQVHPFPALLETTRL